MIVIEPYKESWPATFRDVGEGIRAALGDMALAIHHIGSTSVPGLAAIGFSYRSSVTRDHAPPGMDIDPSQLEKRYYRGTSPDIHLHVRVLGRFNQRYTLLCRDYLRTHALAARAYEGGGTRVGRKDILADAGVRRLNSTTR